MRRPSDGFSRLPEASISRKRQPVPRGQRKMDCHLVTVEVGVERGTSQRMQLDCTTFYQDGFKCLNTQTVQCRCTVQQNGVILDDGLRGCPILGLCALDHLLADLMLLAMPFPPVPFITKGLNSSIAISFGRPH